MNYPAASYREFQVKPFNFVIFMQLLGNLHKLYLRDVARLAGKNKAARQMTR